MGAAASIVNGMATSQVHDALIKAAADLISADNPNYSKVAARLAIFKIRKDAHGQYEYLPRRIKAQPLNSKRNLYE